MGKWFKHEGQSRFMAYPNDPAPTHLRMAAADLSVDGRLEGIPANGDAIGRLKWYECRG